MITFNFKVLKYKELSIIEAKKHFSFKQLFVAKKVKNDIT